MGLKLTGRDAEGKHALMTTAPVPRLIGSLAVPTIVSMLVTSFYVMADTYFVGKINTQATAAVGISFSVMAVIRVSQASREAPRPKSIAVLREIFLCSRYISCI